MRNSIKQWKGREKQQHRKKHTANDNKFSMFLNIILWNSKIYLGW